MSAAIEGLKPELVWKYFAEISRIPRGSKNEAAASKYILDTAKKLGLQAKADKLGNVVVSKPASANRENVRAVVLQGHLDMVCEKNKETVHDFLKDPIELVRKENVLMANGTTLGADNGIAVATCLAIMEDRSLEHGPLELLFTVDEETGLTGAANLQPDFVAADLDRLGTVRGVELERAVEVRAQDLPARTRHDQQRRGRNSDAATDDVALRRVGVDGLGRRRQRRTDAAPSVAVP